MRHPPRNFPRRLVSESCCRLSPGTVQPGTRIVGIPGGVRGVGQKKYFRSKRSAPKDGAEIDGLVPPAARASLLEWRSTEVPDASFNYRDARQPSVSGQLFMEARHEVFRADESRRGHLYLENPRETRHLPSIFPRRSSPRSLFGPLPVASDERSCHACFRR